jgi:hypothetical protein
MRPQLYLDLRVGQGFESAVGPRFEGLSGCLNGTLNDRVGMQLTTNATVMPLKAFKKSGFTPALT